MRACVQRVRYARVEVDDRVVGSIGLGLLALVGVERGDGPADVAHLAGKVRDLRIFDERRRRGRTRMNRSVLDAGGAVLVVSQFTLTPIRGQRAPAVVRRRRAARRRAPALRGRRRRLRASGVRGGDRRVPGGDEGGARERRPRDVRRSRAGGRMIRRSSHGVGADDAGRRWPAAAVLGAVAGVRVAWGGRRATSGRRAGRGRPRGRQPDGCSSALRLVAPDACRLDEVLIPTFAGLSRSEIARPVGGRRCRRGAVLPRLPAAAGRSRRRASLASGSRTSRARRWSRSVCGRRRWGWCSGALSWPPAGSSPR